MATSYNFYFNTVATELATEQIIDSLGWPFEKSASGLRTVCYEFKEAVGFVLYCSVTAETLLINQEQYTFNRVWSLIINKFIEPSVKYNNLAKLVRQATKEHMSSTCCLSQENERVIFLYTKQTGYQFEITDTYWIEYFKGIIPAEQTFYVHFEEIDYPVI